MVIEIGINRMPVMSNFLLGFRSNDVPIFYHLLYNFFQELDVNGDRVTLTPAKYIPDQYISAM